MLNGRRVPLVSPQGIFKPRVLSEAPLSITTVPDGPYDDAFGPNDLLQYRYRGTDPEHPDNRSLALCKLHHAAFDRYFLGVRPDYVLQVRPDQHFLERRYENFRRA